MCGRLAAIRSATWSFSLSLRCLPLCLIPPSCLPHSCLPPPALVLLLCITAPHTSPLWRRFQICRHQGSLLHAVNRELKALGSSHTVCCAHTACVEAVHNFSVVDNYWTILCSRILCFTTISNKVYFSEFQFCICNTFIIIIYLLYYNYIILSRVMNCNLFS